MKKKILMLIIFYLKKIFYNLFYYYFKIKNQSTIMKNLTYSFVLIACLFLINSCTSNNTLVMKDATTIEVLYQPVGSDTTTIPFVLRTCTQSINCGGSVSQMPTTTDSAIYTKGIVPVKTSNENTSPASIIGTKIGKLTFDKNGYSNPVIFHIVKKQEVNSVSK